MLHRILIVEDNADLADSLAAILRVEGYDAQVAYGGEEAIKLAQSVAFSAVLLDIGMPILSGYDVAREIKKQAKPARPLLIGLSGFGAQSDKVLAKQLGFDHYFTKPVNFDELLALLAEMLAKRA